MKTTKTFEEAAEHIMSATRRAMAEWRDNHPGEEFADMDARLEYINKRVFELTTEADREAAESYDAHAAEAEQQPTETENAPQAATQAAEGTDEKKEDKTMTTTEREALERINARQNAANLFTNITPADIAAELAAMEAEQAAPAPDPDAVTLAPADAAQVWTEDGKTVATATEADQQPTETAEAAQADPAARQADPITAAIIGAISAPAPAHTITVTWTNGTRATYSAAMLDLLRADPAALDIQDDETGEMVYIKPDPAPAAQAEADPTETTEQTTTNEQKEEDNTMSATAFTPAEAAMHEATARGIIRRKGGYRERDILNHPHTIERGTWTTEHKVVEILETTPDPDGYRAGCAVDIVTRSIVG